MKYILLTLGLFIHTNIFSQTKDPIEVTPALLIKIKQDIEREVPEIKKKLEMAGEDAIHIEFSLDTFKIERLIVNLIDLDYSDVGLLNAGNEASKNYDILLNKYYKKLLARLKGDDKKALVSAQKSWISYRDIETKLVETISKEEYSGGGTVQLLTESTAYYNLIKDRTIAIFEHYVRALQNN